MLLGVCRNVTVVYSTWSETVKKQHQQQHRFVNTEDRPTRYDDVETSWLVMEGDDGTKKKDPGRVKVSVDCALEVKRDQGTVIPGGKLTLTLKPRHYPELFLSLLECNQLSNILGTNLFTFW